jgi:hypothetical protein
MERSESMPGLGGYVDKGTKVYGIYVSQGTAIDDRIAAVVASLALGAVHTGFFLRVPADSKHVSREPGSTTTTLDALELTRQKRRVLVVVLDVGIVVAVSTREVIRPVVGHHVFEVAEWADCLIQMVEFKEGHA